MARRLLIALVALAALAPAAHAATPGTPIQLPALDACISQAGSDGPGGSQQVCRDGSGLSHADSVTVSPDGANAYAASFGAGLSIMARDPATGALSPLGCLSSDGTDGGSGSCTMGRFLDEPIDVAVSPDGKNAYVAVKGGIAVFDRAAGGLLTQPSGTAACISEDGSGGTCVDGKNIEEPISLAFSADGATLYATDGRGGVAVLRRAADGTLSQDMSDRAGCITEDGKDQDNLLDTTACVDGRGLRGTGDVVVSPDSNQVYTTSNGSQAVTVLERDQDSGELSQADSAAVCISEDGNDGTDPGDAGACTKGRALTGPGSVRVSPDGRDVYVSAFFSNAVAIFSRDAVTGQLTQKPGSAGCVSEDGSEMVGGPTDACLVGRGLEAAFGLAFSPDGENLYVGSFTFDSTTANIALARAATEPVASGGIVAFARDATSGALQQLPASDGCISEIDGPTVPSIADGCAPGIGLQGIDKLALSPDGGNLYVAAQGSDAVAEFARAGLTPAGAPGDRTAPRVSRFSLTHRTFAVAHAATPLSALVRGTSFRFALSEPARVSIAIKRLLPGRRAGGHCRKPSRRLRKHRACTRPRPAGTLRRAEQAGPATVRFSGRIGRRALRPGRYRATIRAVDAAGNRSRASSLRFRVVKPRGRR